MIEIELVNVEAFLARQRRLQELFADCARRYEALWSRLGGDVYEQLQARVRASVSEPAGGNFADPGSAKHAADRLRRARGGE